MQSLVDARKLVVAVLLQEVEGVLPTQPNHLRLSKEVVLQVSSNEQAFLVKSQAYNEQFSSDSLDLPYLYCRREAIRFRLLPPSVELPEGCVCWFGGSECSVQLIDLMATLAQKCLFIGGLMLLRCWLSFEALHIPIEIEFELHIPWKHGSLIFEHATAGPVVPLCLFRLCAFRWFRFVHEIAVASRH